MRVNISWIVFKIIFLVRISDKMPVYNYGKNENKLNVLYV